MHVLLLLLLDTVPSDIDIGDNDSDSQEATPTSSVASPPEHATSFLPGSERRQVEKGHRRTQTNTFQCFTHHFTCKISCSALCILSVVHVSSVSAHVSVSVCVRLCSQTFSRCLMEAALCLANMAVLFLFVV